MSSFQTHRRWIAAVACLSLVTPSVGTSAEPKSDASLRRSIADVRLSNKGTLHGQLVDRAGNPVVNSPVVLATRGNLLSQTTTNRRGEFRFEQVRGGVYNVLAGNSGGIYRLWTARTAPPSSQGAILLVDGAAVRGQQAGLGAGHYDGAILKSLNSPWVLAGLVGAGMAVPIVISNDDDNEGS